MLDAKKHLWKSDSYIDAVALGKKIKGRKEYIVVDTLELPHKIKELRFKSLSMSEYRLLYSPKGNE